MYLDNRIDNVSVSEPNGLHSLSFYDDSSKIAMGGISGKVSIYTVSTKAIQSDVIDFNTTINCIDVSSDGDIVVGGG